MIGSMAMPADFPYKDIFLKGQPVHTRLDPFRIRHPSMDLLRRAKIFAPFDALKGFSEAISEKEILYSSRRELSEGEKEELNRRIAILYRLTASGPKARKNSVTVSVTYFLSCGESSRGQYITVSGIVQKVGMTAIRIDETVIPLTDIAAVESDSEYKGRPVFGADEWDAS